MPDTGIKPNDLKANLMGMANLFQASSTRIRDKIPKGNTFRILGFEEDNPRLGWVIPPTLEDIMEVSKRFLDLDVVKGKTRFVFVGMGGSINSVKALIKILGNQSSNKLYTLDSLDPAAMADLFASLNSLPNTLAIAISKSGTTTETRLLADVLMKKFEEEGLEYKNHFLWLTDLPESRKKLVAAGWRESAAFSIQVDGGNDIGGRFSAPHTLIFLIPLLLLLEGNLSKLEAIWQGYLELRENLMREAAQKAQGLAEHNTSHFAIVLEVELSDALETWIIQLFQESLGSKIPGYNPKTVVTSSDFVPDGFEKLYFNVTHPNIICRAMVIMYLLQLFVALFSFEKGINFVNQPEVESYKSEMKEVPLIERPEGGKINALRLVDELKSSNIIKQVKFLEVVSYWYLQEEERKNIRQTLAVAFPGKEIFVFAGSDWNHHSYQAASKNMDTLFIILIKGTYESKVKGISKEVIMENTNVLKRIAKATFKTLKQKAIFLVVN